MSASIQKFFRRVGPSTLCALLILGSISGLLTYGGMDLAFSPEREATWHKSIAAMVALGVTVLSTLFWAYALGTIPGLRNPRHRRAGFGVVAVFLVAIFCLSSTWNVVFMSVKETARLNLLAAVALVDERKAAFGLWITAPNALLLDIERFKKDLEQKKRNEGKFGAITGSPGCGGACRSIGTIANSVGILVQQQMVESRKLDGTLDKIDTLLEKMRALDENEKTRNVMDRAAALAAKINALMASAQSQDRAGTIQRAMENLPASFVVSRLRTRAQRDGITRFKRYLAVEAGKIRDRARELKNTPPVPPIKIDRPNPLKSVFRHWTSLLPQWSASVSLDWLPALILAYLVLGAKDTRDPDKKDGPPDPGDMGVDDLLRAKKMLGLLDDHKPRKTPRRKPRKRAPRDDAKSLEGSRA